jgi:hypothetical protein
MKRGIVLNVSDIETRTMALPIGKQCKDCRLFGRCEALITIKPDNEVCDFYPNRFTEKVA